MKEVEEFRNKVLDIIRQHIKELDCVEDYETVFELGILFEKVRAIGVDPFSIAMEPINKNDKELIRMAREGDAQ